MFSLKEPIEFEWSIGNQEKNWEKHTVSISEAEEAFFDDEKRISKDFFHSETEDRYILLGKTRNNRILFIVFTKRNNKIRVISARDLNKKEYFLLNKKGAI